MTTFDHGLVGIRFLSIPDVDAQKSRLHDVSSWCASSFWGDAQAPTGDTPHLWKPGGLC